MKTRRDELVFLVRMWQAPGEHPRWRGSVQDVAAGIRLYVTETRDVGDFIAARLAEKSGESDEP